MALSVILYTRSVGRSDNGDEVYRYNYVKQMTPVEFKEHYKYEGLAYNEMTQVSGTFYAMLTELDREL
jgi:hypothetical protein